MVRVLWFGLALASALLGVLTVLKAPTLTGWKLAVLATEFGHTLAVLVAVVALGAAVTPARSAGGRRLRRSTVVLAFLAGALLTSPSVRAWGMADDVARAVRLAFGGGTADDGAAFRFGALLSAVPQSPAGPEIFTFARHEATELELDFYRAVPVPAHRGRGAPCVVVVHGGGWDDGSRTQLTELNRVLAAQGTAVASMDYRLAPRWTWPAPRDDVHAALRWLREQADLLGIDPRRFILLGRSAGAQIALAAAYDRTDAEVRGVVAIHGPADLNFAYTYGREDDVLGSLALLRAYLGGTPAERPGAYDDASPFRLARTQGVPTLLIHGKLDTLVWHRQSERLAAELAAGGVPHVLVSPPWATHAFDFNLSGPSGQLTRFALERFIAAVAPPSVP